MSEHFLGAFVTIATKDAQANRMETHVRKVLSVSGIEPEHMNEHASEWPTT